MLQDPTLAVVHGLVWQHGRPSAHGWVEIGDVCIFRGFKGKKRNPGHFATRWEEYYSELVIRETTRYTVAEALAENYRHQTYGPWVDRYLKYCKPKEGARP